MVESCRRRLDAVAVEGPEELLGPMGSQVAAKDESAGEKSEVTWS